MVAVIGHSGRPVISVWRRTWLWTNLGMAAGILVVMGCVTDPHWQCLKYTMCRNCTLTAEAA